MQVGEPINKTTLSRARRFERTFLVLEGRIGRLQFLMRSIVVSVVATLAFALILVMLSVLRRAVGPVGVVPEAAAVVCYIAYGVLVLGIWLSASVRRLHDIGHSGAWVVFLLVPFLNLVLWIYLMITPSEEGENEYGLQPRHEEHEPV